MPAPDWIERLKKKWNLKNVWQVVIILIVFACTGITALFIKRPVMQFLGGSEGGWKASVIYYVFILTPLYNILLLSYGFIFGQFSFFWEFEKKMFRKIFRRSSGNRSPTEKK